MHDHVKFRPRSPVEPSGSRVSHEHEVMDSKRARFACFFLAAMRVASVLAILPSRGFALQVANSPQGVRPQAASESGKLASQVPATRIDGKVSFEDSIDHSGIQFQLKNSISPQRYSIETMLGGVAVFDYNNDGLLDISLPTGRVFHPSRNLTQASGTGCIATMATAPLPMSPRKRALRESATPWESQLRISTTTALLICTWSA